MNRRQAIVAIAAGGTLAASVVCRAGAGEEKVRTVVQAGPAAPAVLTPEKAMRHSDGAVVTVEFQVLAVGTYTGTSVGLDFRAARTVKQDQFVVVLSEKAQAQLKRVGVHDLDRHFRGKRVRVAGPVSRDWFTGLDEGDYYRLQVDDISQFEQVD